MEDDFQKIFPQSSRELQNKSSSPISRPNNHHDKFGSDKKVIDFKAKLEALRERKAYQKTKEESKNTDKLS